MAATIPAASTDFDWTAVAPGWDTHRATVEAMKEQVTRELLSGLRLQPGDRVLELAAGTGELALKLAGAVGPTGHLIASDAAAGMVELLRTTLGSAANVEVDQLDARATGLPDSSVDAVVMRMGLMLVDDPAAVLRECRRILAPRGRLAVAVWAGPEHNPWMTCFGMAMMMNGLASGGPPTGPGGIFSLADPAALEAAVSAAGFHDVAVHDVATSSVFASSDDHFDSCAALAGPLSGVIAAAPEATHAAVRTSMASFSQAYRTDDGGLVLPGRALVCTGTVV